MIENEILKYAVGGVVISVADKLSSDWAKGRLHEIGDKKKDYQALEFILDTYKKEEFEAEKKDPEFAEAFVRVKQYFASKAKAKEESEQAADAEADEESKKSYAPRKKGFIANAKKVFSADYWKNEKINPLKAKYKAAGSVVIPVFFDISYLIGGASFSSFLGEVAETALEAPSMFAGLYIGKGINKFVDGRINRYDKKIAKLEKKIAMNEDLSKALADEKIVEMPKIKPETLPPNPVAEEKKAKAKKQAEAEKPVEAQAAAAEEPKEPEQPAEPEQSTLEKINQDHNSLVERMNRLAGGK